MAYHVTCCRRVSVTTQGITKNDERFVENDVQVCRKIDS